MAKSKLLSSYYYLFFLLLVFIADGVVGIQFICNRTTYPELCYNSLASMAKLSHHDDNVALQEAYKLSVKVTMEELARASDGLVHMQEKFKNVADHISIRALQVCHNLFSISIRCLNDSYYSSIKFNEPILIHEVFADLNVWLTTAGTNQQNCADTIIDHVKDATLRRKVLKNYLEKSAKLTSNSLAILVAFEESVSLDIHSKRILNDTLYKKLIHDRSEMTTSLNRHYPRNLFKYSNGTMPRWLRNSEERKLLLETSAGKMQIDALVAKDGSGKYSTISDALKAVPDNSGNRFVIYVKKGVYDEIVRVEISKSNVMMIGDGMDSTIVTGNRNVADGSTTADSATFAVYGEGFIARDMGFQNTAGAAKEQAVALLANGDRGVYYRCKFDGYQDTIFASGFRQFFQQCNIYGTIDFIFGYAAAVFQACNIYPRRPMPGQQNTIVAQGKEGDTSNSGFSFQDCTISPAEDLAGAKTFLGRPWKSHSTTVFIHTNMGSLIDPKGWAPFSGETVPDTVYYAEYQNSGPGAGKEGRVQWKGLHLEISSDEAEKFTVKYLIGGEYWLPNTGVSFKSGL